MFPADAAAWNAALARLLAPIPVPRAETAAGAARIARRSAAGSPSTQDMRCNCPDASNTARPPAQSLASRSHRENNGRASQRLPLPGKHGERSQAKELFQLEG